MGKRRAGRFDQSRKFRIGSWLFDNYWFLNDWHHLRRFDDWNNERLDLRRVDHGDDVRNDFGESHQRHYVRFDDRHDLRNYLRNYLRNRLDDRDYLRDDEWLNHRRFQRLSGRIDQRFRFRQSDQRNNEWNYERVVFGNLRQQWLVGKRFGFGRSVDAALNKRTILTESRCAQCVPAFSLSIRASNARGKNLRV